MNNWKEKIPAIFAEQGDIVEVPLDAQTDSQVSFETGYTVNYERDAVDELGNPLVQYGIERTKFNYLMKVLTTAIKEVQEVIPVYTEGTTDKVDVSSVITATNTFDVLESLLCIDNATGKASRITKEDIIANLHPDVNLSNDNITISELATTAMDNFLSIDGDIIKKADKMLQSVIEEINLSADNVVISATTTFDNTDSIVVTNAEGKVAKATTIPQEKIENINVSKDNISIDEYTDQEPDATFKPIIASDSGKLYTKDTLSSEMIESVKPEQIDGDVFAKAIKYTVMDKDTYPDGLDNLIQTGLYHVIDHDDYKDMINDEIDTTEKEEYILKVMNPILTKSRMVDTELTTFEELAKIMESDLISPYNPIIQVIGVSADNTDDTKVTQIFSINGKCVATRTFTATVSGLVDDTFKAETSLIRNYIEEELIDFMYDGDATAAKTDVDNMRRFMTISYNGNDELCYAINFLGEVYPNVVTINTDLAHDDISDQYDSDFVKYAIKYNESLYYKDDTKIIKVNKKEADDNLIRPIVRQLEIPKEVGNHVLMVKDRNTDRRYIALVNYVGNGLLLQNHYNLPNEVESVFNIQNYMKIHNIIGYTEAFLKTATLIVYNMDNLNNIPKTELTNDLSVFGTTTLKGNLSVNEGTTTTINSDTVAINSPTTVNDDLTVTGTLNAGSFQLPDNFNVDDLTVGNNLTVSGHAALNGSTAINGTLTLKSDYEGGHIFLDPNNTNWTDETSKKGINIDRFKNDELRIFTGSPVVHYASMQQGDVRFHQNTAVEGNLNVTGTISNTDLQNKLNAKLDKTGGTVSGGLTVNGTTSLNHTYINGGLTINNLTQINGDLSVSGKIRNKDYVVDTFKSGNSWYRVWSDGWIEQGGTARTIDTTVTFLKTFRDTAYTLVGVGFVVTMVGQQFVTKYTNRFVTGSGTNHCGTESWYACGY